MPNRKTDAAVLAAASAFVAAVASDSDIADLIAALQPGSVIAADGLYAGMADILPDVAQQVCTRAPSSCAVLSCWCSLAAREAVVQLCDAVVGLGHGRPASCPPPLWINCGCFCLQPGDGAAAPTSAAGADLADKVLRVCEALRTAMAAAGQRRYFRATLTSLSKVRQPASTVCRGKAAGAALRMEA